jgi:hypothetical protein
MTSDEDREVKAEALLVLMGAMISFFIGFCVGVLVAVFFAS